MGVIFKVKSLTFIFAPMVNSIIGSAAEPRSSVVSIRTLILSKGNDETNKPAIIAKMNGFLEISMNMFEMAISNIFIEISKNPFILAMIAGLLVSSFPLERMSVLIDTTELLGSAALPIMLLTIGAKIKVRDLTLKITPIIISNSLKLIILPVIVYFVASYFNLSQIEIVVAVIFASVPTAAMSYSLAQQFGADHQLMRAILTTQVALSFITIPLLLAFIA